MNCQSCGSERIISINAHHSDCFSISERNGKGEHNGYAPEIADICRGDDTFPDICMNCGQVQGKFPKEYPSEFTSQQPIG